MASMSPGSHLGRYEIIELIGRGGMASVFRAHDPLLDRDVAIKVLASIFPPDPTFAERFSIEARTVANLRHPNIVQVYDFGEDDGFTFIVSELVEGGTLQEYANGPISIAEVVRLLKPIAEALDYAHTQGVVHRDIKPSNVLMQGQFGPVLADFGLSRVMERSQNLTAVGESLGTPEYMSPEQAMGRDTDHHSDLYSFGILAYRLLSGKAPFHANTPAGTLMAHVNQTLPPLEETIDLNVYEIGEVLVKATAKEPTDRFETASQFLDALEANSSSESVTQILDTPTVLVPVAGTTPYVKTKSGLMNAIRGWFSLSKTIALTAAIVVVLIASLVGAFIVTRDDTQSESDTPTEPFASSEPVQEIEPLPTQSVSSILPTSVPVATTPDQPVTVGDILREAEKIQAKLDEVQLNVNSIRSIEPLSEIDTEFIESDDLRTLADTFFKRSQLRDQLFETEELLKALGMLDDDDDLESIMNGIVLQQVSALFDDQSGLLYVVSDAPELGPIEEISYASVYMAGLQQQLYNVSDSRSQAIESGSFDEFRAVGAFITGDVVQIQQGYMQLYMDDAQKSELSKPVPDNLISQAPPAIRSIVLFPVGEGGNFVSKVFSELGGWPGVDTVYGRLPVSTEQVIHPQKYLINERHTNPEIPDLVGALGQGWEVVSQNTMGEFLIRTYLEKNLDLSSAAKAAAGWAGDSYVLLLGPEGQSVLVLRVDWDSDKDQFEFVEAYRESIDASLAELEFEKIGEEPETRWITDEETVLIRSGQSSSLILIADSDELVTRVVDFIP